MEIEKSPTVGFWCNVAASLLIFYVGTYGILRWEDVLVHDVIIYKGNDGLWRSGTGITRYADETMNGWQRQLGHPAELAFFPLCEIETAIWNKMRFPE